MLQKSVKWLITGLIVLLIISIYFEWQNYRMNQIYKMNTQANFLTGIGFINQAETLLQEGNMKRASVLGNEGVAYLRASIDGLQGTYYVGGLVNYLDRAMSNLLGNEPSSITTRKHDEYIIRVLNESFKPLGNMNFGTIKAKQFQQAINKVIHAMTPQEQKNVEN